MKKMLSVFMSLLVAIGSLGVVYANDNATEATEDSITETMPFEGTGSMVGLEFATEEDIEMLKNAIPIDMPATMPADIVGDEDSRELVSNPFVKPYSNIAYLLLNYGTGYNYIGTGALVDSDIILTAGHNLDHHQHGELVSMRVYLARQSNSSYLAYQEITNTDQFVLSDDYTDYRDAGNDYGFVKLNNKNMGNSFGWFGLSSTRANTTDTFELAGFANVNDVFSLRMVTDSGNLTTVGSDYLRYNMDCVAGQSGSPIFTSTRYIVGVHTVGTSTYNKGPKVTTTLIALKNELETE